MRHLIESRLFDAAQDDINLMPEPLLGFAQFIVKMGDTLAANVLQLHPFQVVPDPFRWVQLWGIPWKLLQMNPASPTIAQVLFHYPATVDGSPIPEHQQLPSNMPGQVLEEPHHVSSPVGSLLHHQVQFAFWGNPTHGRQVVSAQGSTDGGGLAYRGVGTHLAGQQVETRLVHKDHRPPFCYRLFLIWGQRSSCQRRMVTSSRWVARCTGCWLLQPQAFKMRPTWEGSYETPNRSRIRTATLGWVQTSPWKPKDSAPWARSSSSWPRCSGDSRGGAPGGGRGCKPSTPPSRARFSHWLTAPWVTPRASAISRWFQPFWCSSQARKRPPTRQLVAWLDKVFSMESSLPNPRQPRH